MDPEWKKKWVSALRCGLYKQGECYLRTSAGFCCLGVLSDISGKGEWEAIEGRGGSFRYLSEGRSYLHLLPLSVSSAAFPDGEPLDKPGLGTLMNMNDSGVPFPEIADFIEENF